MPPWLSSRAFIASCLAMGAVGYPQAAKLGFSNEGISQWVVTTVVGGLVWGVAITWAMKRYFARPGSPEAVAERQQPGVTAEDAKARTNSTVSYALLGLAFGLPIITAYLWTGRYAQAGALWAEMGMAYVVLVFLSWAIFRKKTKATMSYVRLAVNSALLVWSVVVTVSTWSVATAEDGRGRRFAEQMIEHAKKQQMELVALNAKFELIDLASVLTAEKLTTLSGITESRGKLNSFTGLIAERGELVKRMITEGAKVIQTAEISETDRKSAMNGFNEKTPGTIDMYRRLDAAQLSTVKAAIDMLDFAQANLGKTGAKDGQILFANQALVDEYQRLLARVRVSAAAEEKVMKYVAERSEGAREDMRTFERNLRRQ